MKLNPQQRQAVRHKSGPLLIIAGAGTGKTTVITERVKYLIQRRQIDPQHVLALTFTDKAAQEMLERLDVVMPLGYQEPWLSTFHAFGDRILRAHGLEIGLDPDYRILTQPEQWLFIKKHLFEFALSHYRPLGNPAKFISALITFFSRAQDEAVDPQKLSHFARTAKIPHLTEVARAYHTYQQLKFTHSVLDFGDLIILTRQLFITRPSILKTYQGQFRHILIDEFQDTNFAQYQLIKLLAPASRQPNLVVVADDDQCLPPTAKVDTSNGQVIIKNIKTGDQVITAVGKGHLSSSKVIHVHKTKKQARFITFITESGKKLTVTDNHKMFCMIPGHKFGPYHIYYVYLMWRQDMGWRLGITDDLPLRLRLERSADTIIAAKACVSLEEALLSEAVLSLKYQIPTYPFKPRKQMKITGKWLEKLYSNFDTEKNAQKLATDLGLNLDSHHFCLDGVYRGSKQRVKVILRMCARKYRTKWARNRLLINPQVAHVVRVETSSPKVRDLLLQAGLPVRKAKKGWQVKRQFIQLELAGKFARKLQQLTGGFLEARFDVGKRNGFARYALVMPAQNILEGMFVPIKHGYEVTYDRVIERQEEIKNQTVYDLEVERTHNFIADGVVVHNSIYKWRGAALTNVLNFKHDYPQVKVVTLIKNYRSFKPILTAAYKVIQHNNPDRLEVKLKLNKHLTPTRRSTKSLKPKIIALPAEIDETEWITRQILDLAAQHHYTYQDFAILTRANSQLDPFVAAFRRHGLPYQLVGNRGLFDQPEVRQLLFFLKVLVNPHDSISLFQLLHTQGFDFPPALILDLIHRAKLNRVSLWDRLQEQTLPSLQNLVQLLTSAQATLAHRSLTQIVYDFLTRTDYLKQFVGADTLAAQLKIQNLNLFLNFLKRLETDFKDSPAIELIDHLDLLIEAGANPAQAEIEDIDTIRLITIHSAKGLEFPVVFLPSLVTGRFPAINRADPIDFPAALIKNPLPAAASYLQEERRLFYVGLTRARDFLYLTWAKDYGGVRSRYPSGFLTETGLTTHPVTTPSSLPLLTPAPPPILPATPTSFKLKSVSFSQIDTFKACPLKYKYRYVLKVPAAPHHSLTFGQSLHDTLRHFHQLEQAGAKLTLKKLLQLYRHYFRPEGYDSSQHKQQRLKAGDRALRHYFKVYRSHFGTPQYLEQSFRLNIAGIPLVGTIDRIDKVKDGYEIIDYKTGESAAKKDVDKDEQLSIYALAAKQALGITPQALSLYFIELNRKLSTRRSAKDLTNTFDRLKTRIAAIKASDFSATPGSPFPCDFCEYNTICPFAAKKR